MGHTMTIADLVDVMLLEFLGRGDVHEGNALQHVLQMDLRIRVGDFWFDLTTCDASNTPNPEQNISMGLGEIVGESTR